MRLEDQSLDAPRAERCYFYASNLAGAVWLVFLAWPIMVAWRHEPRTVAVLAIGLILLFAVLYIWALAQSDAYHQRHKTTPAPKVLLVFAAEVVISGVIIVLLGPNTISVAIFLIPLAVFLFVPPLNLVVSFAIVVVVFVVPFLVDTQLSGFLNGALALGVFSSCVLSDFFTIHEIENQKMKARTAVLDERERVARDVHDVLGHSLTLISVKSELAERLVGVDDEAARREILDVAELSRKAIVEVRQTVSGLRVRQLGEEFTHVTSLFTQAGIALTVDGEPRDVDPRYRILFAWVLREAATNVVRHSEALSVHVSFEQQAMYVADDGVGFDPVSGIGNGLIGVRERVNQAGGVFEIDSGSGQGTRLGVLMPARPAVSG